MQQIRAWFSKSIPSAQRYLTRAWQETQRFLRTVPWSRVRPGWYVLLGLLLYSVFATIQWQSATAQLTQSRAKLAVFEKAAAFENAKLIFPILSATVPQNVDNLPNAPRPYRRGVSQGMVFTGVDAGVRVTYGMPVQAVADGKIKLLVSNFKELTTAEFLKLLEKVKDGASLDDLNVLRGRQVHLLHSNGMVTRYGHLSKIAENLTYASIVKRGDIIGYVGNSGTLDGTRGNQNNARLLLEVWLENESKFLGAGLTPVDVRQAINKVFKAR